MTKVTSGDESKAETFFNALAQMTPAQAEIWIDANVTDLASAKQAMSKMAKLLVAIVKRLESQ